jgi:hypothetical protein
MLRTFIANSKSSNRLAPRLPLLKAHFSTSSIMPGKYAEFHGPEKENGPGDARPTALQIIKDEGLEGKMTDKVFLVTGTSAGMLSFSV